jgi:hypothetical protein
MPASRIRIGVLAFATMFVASGVSLSFFVLGAAMVYLAAGLTWRLGEPGALAGRPM